MTNNAEQRHIEANLAVIRHYLQENFPDYEFTEDKSYFPECHRFALTNLKFHKSYKLEVSGHQLSDTENMPDKTRTALNHKNVAEQMRYADGDYFKWGRI